MPSDYLTGVSGLYGLPSQLPAGIAAQASSIIDAYLKRPEGLAYETDANGLPIFMPGLSPTLTYTIAADIAPGSNVTVAVKPANVSPFLIGEVLILDAETDAREACLVAAVQAPNLITLQTVAFSHSQGAGAAAGLVITEDRSLPSKRSIARVAKWPVVNVLSVLGRYAYGRRSDQVGGLYQEMNLLAAVQTFGGPPQWIPVPIGQVDWSGAGQSGSIWIPAGMLLAYYSDVRIKYVAGFAANAVPDCIVRAAASVAAALINNAPLGGQIKSFASGQSKLERFFASSLDEDARAQLAPYAARNFY